MTPLFYTESSRDTFQFIYFSGFRYEIVSIENYSGASDWLRRSGATKIDNCYIKAVELNKSIDDRNTLITQITTKLKESDYSVRHTMETCVDRTTGLRTLVATSEYDLRVHENFKKYLTPEEIALLPFKLVA